MANQIAAINAYCPRTKNGTTVKTGAIGKIKLKTRISNDIIKKLNIQGAFKGTILNKENIGKTGDELVAMWNEANPGDPVA